MTTSAATSQRSGAADDGAPEDAVTGDRAEGDGPAGDRASGDRAAGGRAAWDRAAADSTAAGDAAAGDAERDGAAQAGAVGVRAATSLDASRLTSVLARAFEDDPVLTWCIPGRADRRTYLPRFFRIVVEALAAHNETHVAADGDAVALWVPPGRDAVTTDHGALLDAELERLPDDDAQRRYELTSLMADCHPHEPSYYLWFMAVTPERQGHGLGSVLLEHALRRCDAQEAPAYVAATTPRNRDLYARHGFRVTGEIAVVGAPPLWGMWRDPR